MQYHAIPCNTMQYHAIPCIINNCLRSAPLPSGQYKAIFLFVLVCIELYAITAGNTSKLPTLPPVISCLSLSWILNWENSSLKKIAFSALLSNLSQSFWKSCTYAHETHILESVANLQLVHCLFDTFLQLFLLMPL